jgi:hypothetical protein
MITYVFKKHEIFLITMKINEFFLKYIGKLLLAGAGAGIFDMLEPELEPDKNGPAPQHWKSR